MDADWAEVETGPHPQGLRGRPLRRAALAVLLRAGGAVSITGVLEAIEAGGGRVGAAYPRKAVADALAYEHDRGWAVRVGRGVYRAGTISRSSQRRVLAQPW